MIIAPTTTSTLRAPRRIVHGKASTLTSSAPLIKVPSRPIIAAEPMIKIASTDDIVSALKAAGTETETIRLLLLACDVGSTKKG